jgi:isoamylase
LVLRRAAAGSEGHVSVLALLLNSTAEDRLFRLPEPHWKARVLLESASDIVDERQIDGVSISVAAHSVVLLHSEGPKIG